MPSKNFDSTLKTLDGQDALDNGNPVILRNLVTSALLNGADEKTPPGEKVERYSLAVKLNEGGDQSLTPEQIVLIKGAVGKLYTPIVVGQLFELLDE